MRLETERLILRDYTKDDFDALFPILSDPETMAHYPAPFDAEKTRQWIDRNLKRYETDGFGLWAVELKATGEFIGDCGLTLQNIDGEMLPEIGYHIRRDLTRRGYGSEAAQACKKLAFEVYGFDAVYSYMKHTNLASRRVAEKNGMRHVKDYPNPTNFISSVYVITREMYLSQKNAQSVD